MDTKASSIYHEKDRPAQHSPKPVDESPTRLEDGKLDGVYLSEEEALAKARADPESTRPIYITFGENDPSNPRHFADRKKWCVQTRTRRHHYTSSGVQLQLEKWNSCW
jgi:hypothetical protein